MLPSIQEIVVFQRYIWVSHKQVCQISVFGLDMNSEADLKYTILIGLKMLGLRWRFEMEMDKNNFWFWLAYWYNIGLKDKYEKLVEEVSKVYALFSSVKNSRFKSERNSQVPVCFAYNGGPTCSRWFAINNRLDPLACAEIVESFYHSYIN